MATKWLTSQSTSTLDPSGALLPPVDLPSDITGVWLSSFQSVLSLCVSITQFGWPYTPLLNVPSHTEIECPAHRGDAGHKTHTRSLTHTHSDWNQDVETIKNQFQIVRSIGIVCLWVHQYLSSMPLCLSDCRTLQKDDVRLPRLLLETYKRRSHGGEEKTVQSMASFH